MFNFKLKTTTLLLILIGFLACKKEKSNSVEKIVPIEIEKDNIQKSKIKKDTLTKVTTATIDSVSIAEIKRNIEKKLPSIFEYYHEEKTGDYTTWSQKLFGRCCSNTDLSFTENLYLKITSNSANKKYPISNISDATYLSAYSFNKAEDLEIKMQLDLENSFLKGKYSNKNLLDDKEIIMTPIRLSLINGYVKSEALFYKNGRVKNLDLYLNNKYLQTFVLIDTPLVQEISVDATFTTSDVLTLKPKSYYLGTEFDDICISEIQTNLGTIASPHLNEKFNLIELMNKGN